MVGGRADGKEWWGRPKVRETGNAERKMNTALGRWRATAEKQKVAAG